MRCNPLNVLSYTLLTEPLKCPLGEISGRVEALGDKLPSPFAEHPDVCPVMPQQGYIIRADLVGLSDKRAAIAQMVDEGAGMVAERDVPIGFETDYIGTLPPGSDDIVPTDEDRAMSVDDKFRLCSYEALMTDMSTVAARRFFHSYQLFVIKGKYDLPRLLKVSAYRLAEGRDAMCCLFEKSDDYVWVDGSTLKSTRLVLESRERVVGDSRHAGQRTHPQV